MNREQALPYVSFCLDDALSPFSGNREIPPDAVLVGWQCGFEPLFVAVWSYLPGCKVDADSAVEIAQEYLAEINWFGIHDGELPEPDYVIT